jgi:hypothetical protein
MAALKVSVSSSSPQHELPYSGNLIESIIDTVDEVMIAAKRAAAERARPKAPSYWFPKFQEWMTLDAAEYRSTLAKAAI